MLSCLLSLTLASSVLHLQANGQTQERTVFQTGSTYSDRINLRADVAIVYGFDKSMPARVKAWRDRGYKVHLMTGVAWGNYQDYYYGRWDGVSHQDEVQTRKNGEKVGHGGDVFYMSPGANYGKYLAEGVRRALEVGVEAVHLEEPEFWTFGGYGEGFKREWKSYYGENWQDPESSPDARWHAAKLMYFLYRRALQQVFDSIQAYNKDHGTHVRCYVPTHSLLNYSQWNIVSPESSLAKLNGCDGYIAQVWTGTARTPNYFQGIKKERTFETAFLEYGAMQNLVRSTGRGVWYLADPIEDDPNHDWNDYRDNWHSTLIASLFQTEVSKYEAMPWPERIFNGKYPAENGNPKRIPIPQSYATELQVVINALKNMDQKSVKWECGFRGLGVMISDSLMFQRGAPSGSDPDLSSFYGLALPFLSLGTPVQPVQLENVGLPGYLSKLKVLVMTYEGMKPLSPEVHNALASWIREGGTLAFVDTDSDPYLKVREWWNTGSLHYRTPRLHLFEKLGISGDPHGGTWKVGAGSLLYVPASPSQLAHEQDSAYWLVEQVPRAAPKVTSNITPALILRRGPYVIGAGLDISGRDFPELKGHFIDLFHVDLPLVEHYKFGPRSRELLVDLDKYKETIIAASGEVKTLESNKERWVGTIEGIGDTEGVLMLRVPRKPKSATADGKVLPASPYLPSDSTAVFGDSARYDEQYHLLRLKFPNKATPQKIEVAF